MNVYAVVYKNKLPIYRFFLPYLSDNGGIIIDDMAKPRK